jgi:hypothetical protein
MSQLLMKNGAVMRAQKTLNVAANLNRWLCNERMSLVGQSRIAKELN